MSAESKDSNPCEFKQLATFYLGDRMYGIDVKKVQEVILALPITPIRIAPAYVKGLINLRGQIATVIRLGDLFGVKAEEAKDYMSVVCRVDGNLLSLQVDRIGDVVEVFSSEFEKTPDTIDDAVKKFMTGVYKSENDILSVIEVDKIFQELNKRVGAAA